MSDVNPRRREAVEWIHDRASRGEIFVSASELATFADITEAQAGNWLDSFEREGIVELYSDTTYRYGASNAER